jgi:hypothetical protein
VRWIQTEPLVGGAGTANVEAALRELSNVDEGWPGAAEVFEAAALCLIPTGGEPTLGPFMAALASMTARRIGQTQVREMLRRVPYRYLGGLPGVEPGDAKVEWVRDNQLVVTSARGHVLAVIPPERMLAASTFLHESGPTANVGIGFGHVLYFPDFSFLGGALNLAWVNDRGGLSQFSIGNRDGLLVSKGPAEFYHGLTLLLGSWGNMAATAHQWLVGPIQYARELGFR